MQVEATNASQSSSTGISLQEIQSTFEKSQPATSFSDSLSFSLSLCIAFFPSVFLFALPVEAITAAVVDVVVAVAVVDVDVAVAVAAVVVVVVTVVVAVVVLAAVVAVLLLCCCAVVVVFK
eukprot:TRINITY_DN11353_c0_g1_i3.p1 TRINITY_DN11353_c0_g1~~TRINITY_DN11353_c0_g1_i3.p1  ORF type:complete len:121 (+),score=24.66 TRINITY_DN11353_c0_g1_i3:499-861(+)